MKEFLIKKGIMFVLFALLTCSLVYAGGKKENNKERSDASPIISVFASILPQKYFVERIGGERVRVDVMVKPGQSPETYEPTPDQIIKLSSSDIFFTIGVPFETQFLPSISASLKNLKIADTSDGVTKRYMKQYEEGEDHHDDHDDHGHSHGEGALDPHIWLSPVAVKIQAVNIFNTLSEIDPDGRDYYKNNLDGFIEDLDDVHAQLKEILAPYRGKTIFVFHPAFGYFADEYGLRQEAIETGGKDPAPATLLRIIEKALEEEVRIIFVQPEFPRKSAESVAKAINGSVVVLNPLNPDYLNNLLYLAEEVKKALIK